MIIKIVILILTGFLYFFTYGFNQINIQADTHVPPNLLDMTFPSEWSCSGINSDYNGDGVVDAVDVQRIGFTNGSTISDPLYDPEIDQNSDGTIQEQEVFFAMQCSILNFGNPFSGEIQPIPLPQGPDGLKLDFTPEGFLSQLVSTILPIVLGIAGFIAVILIIISGIQMMLSSGNPEAAAAAQGRLTMTIVGFAVIILAFSFTQIIDKIFLGGAGVF